MLKQSVINEAKQLVEILAKNDVSLTAMPLSPLEALCKASMTAELAINMPSATLDEFGMALAAATQARSVDGSLDHDMTQADVVEMVSGVIARNMDLAKNVVNPICLDVLNRVNEVLDSQATRDLNNIAIVPDFYLSIWESPVLVNLIDGFENVAPEVIEAVSVVPNQSDEQIRKLVVTGVTGFDAEVNELLGTLPGDFLPSVYREVFVRASASDRELSQIFTPYTGDRNAILFAFLMARRLADDVPEGVNMGLGSYRSYLSRVQAQAGYALTRILAIRERDMKTKTLLRTYPVGDGNSPSISISLNGDVYNQWLADGGKPEAILGAFITDKEVRYEQLLEGLNSYVTAWNRHIALRANIISDEKYSRTVAALNLVMKQVIEAQEPGEGKPTKETMFAAMASAVADIHHHDINHFAHLVRKVVCKTMFAHTSAEAILSSMDHISGQYPQMQMSEVALFAAMYHAVNWVVALIQVNK